jgi:ATP-dependent DNA helicase RecG
MTSFKLNDDTKTRLETMVRTSDGFEIADVDLRLRGPGNIQGTQQSGVLDLKIADLSKDSQLLQLSRTAAFSILEDDPLLQKEENLKTANYLNFGNKGNTNWSRIS